MAELGLNSCILISESIALNHCTLPKCPLSPWGFCTCHSFYLEHLPPFFSTCYLEHSPPCFCTCYREHSPPCCCTCYPEHSPEPQTQFNFSSVIYLLREASPHPPGFPLSSFTASFAFYFLVLTTGAFLYVFVDVRLNFLSLHVHMDCVFFPRA